MQKYRKDSFMQRVHYLSPVCIQKKKKIITEYTKGHQISWHIKKQATAKSQFFYSINKYNLKKKNIVWTVLMAHRKVPLSSWSWKLFFIRKNRISLSRKPGLEGLEGGALLRPMGVAMHANETPGNL